MASSEIQDKRLTERELRKERRAPEQSAPAVEELPDSADRAEWPDDEQAERFREELAAEKKARDVRIEKALNEPARPAVPHHPEAPLDDEL